MGDKLWYGSSKYAYDKNNIRYYNVNDYTWATDIEKNWGEIKSELQNLITEKDKNFTSNAEAYKGVDITGKWSSLSSMFWGLNTSASFVRKCPRLFALLRNSPGIVSVSLSRLEPHTKIGEHHGETNAIIRCHLGIEIPSGLPACGMNVAGEERGWEEGKWLFFNDAQNHFAWNDTDKRRILLITDMIRPEFLHKKNLICAKILAAYFIGQREIKYTFIRNLPRAFTIMLFLFVIPTVYILRPIYNALHVNNLYHE
ncbi:MAG: aspartyl/asparaginyl beta-hydroxylase domain-containing protein [Bacteroidia bacterium]